MFYLNGIACDEASTLAVRQRFPHGIIEALWIGYRACSLPIGKFNRVSKMGNCVFCDQDNPTGQLNCRQCGGPLPVSDAEPLTEEVFRQQLLRLLNEGQRIQAVAAYRRRTGVDLNHAVEVIDGLERDNQFNVAPGDADLERAVIAYLERGEKIEAVKFYREKTQLDLKASKDAVEAIETRLGLGQEPTSNGRGCLSMLALMLIAVAAATWMG